MVVSFTTPNTLVTMPFVMVIGKGVMTKMTKLRPEAQHNNNDAHDEHSESCYGWINQNNGHFSRCRFHAFVVRRILHVADAMDVMDALADDGIGIVLGVLGLRPNLFLR